jgi:putative transposase
MGIAVAPSTV